MINQALNLFKSIKTRLSARQFEVVVAIIVGLSAGFLAVVLKSLVHLIQKSLSINHAISHEGTPYMIFYPLIGILLTVYFVRKVLKGDLGRGVSTAELYNINIPTAATQAFRAGKVPAVHCVPMGVERYGDHYIKRQDPKGRNYYWSTNDPPPKPTDHETDLNALFAGTITVTPLQFDMTKRALLEKMGSWGLSLTNDVGNITKLL